MIPQQHTSDMTDNVEALVVGLVAAGGLMLPSESIVRDIAKHLDRFGVRWHESEQTVWYKPPRPDAGWLEQSQGEWVEEPVEPQTSTDVQDMIAGIPDDMRAELIRALGGEPG